MSPGSSRERLLLVGYRRAAFDSALALGFEVALVSERLPAKARRERATRALRADLGDESLRWRELARELCPDGAAAVVALTERAVLPAAELRRALGLPGVVPETALGVTDKLLMKRRIRAAGLAVTSFSGGGNDGPQLAELGLPLVLKPRRSSGSRGVEVIFDAAAVPERVPPGWIAEAFVDGVEMSVESYVEGCEVAFANVTEYVQPRWVNLLPAALEPATRAAIEELNRAAVRALGIERGMTHLELFLTGEGPLFGEIALRPPGGHLMDLLAAVYGFDPWGALFAAELGRPLALPGAADGVGAVRIFHPGAGEVAAVRGGEAAHALPGVERLELRVRPGDTVEERRGVGQEVGFVLVRGADREQALDRLDAAIRTVEITMR